MTRFARAKGSKSSNERVPEHPTPWAAMKQQLLDKNKEAEENKKRQEALDQRNNKYKVFLREKEADELKKTQWAEFPGVSKELNLKKKKVKKEKKAINNFIDSGKDDDFKELKMKVDKVLNTMPKHHDQDELPEETSSNIKSPVINTKKSKMKKNILVDKIGHMNKIPDGFEDSVKNTHINKNGTLKVIKTKLDRASVAKSPKKNKQKDTTNADFIASSDNMDKKHVKLKNKRGDKKLEIEFTSSDRRKNKKLSDKGKTRSGTPKKKVEDLTPEQLGKIEKKKEKKMKQLEKKKKKKAELKLLQEQLQEDKIEQAVDKNQNQAHSSLQKNVFQKIKPPFVNKKPGKVRDNAEHARRKPFLPHKMFINGKELEIDYVDGFPVKKEDANRLKKLKKEMIAKGLPRSEINIALKLERRKAEKAFAREKKKVCFNCRKSGHNLSECPELNKDQVAPSSGGDICYKCGSTEHTHFECKVVRGQSYSYATCFVCNEQGHIARHCPDNPKGLYPKGGACKVCGDVTHLKKDCPQYQSQQQKQEEIFRIGTYGDNNPDSLEDVDSSKTPIVNKRSNKIIKF